MLTSGCPLPNIQPAAATATTTLPPRRNPNPNYTATTTLPPCRCPVRNSTFAQLAHCPAHSPNLTNTYAPT